jgi:hypothetical protein
VSELGGAGELAKPEAGGPGATLTKIDSACGVVGYSRDMRSTMPLLAVLAMLAPTPAAAHPCEAEVNDLAAKVTRLENLVAADRAVVNSAAAAGPQGAVVFDTVEKKLQADQDELRLAWKRLLESQESCNRHIATEARAAQAGTRRVVALDVKAAYAIPVGDVWGSSSWNPAWPMSGAWTGAVPLEIAARYRFTPSLSAGAFFQWGPAFVTSTGFAQIAGSSGSDMRLGIELVYAFTPGAALDPWVGLGTGWQWTSYSSSSASVTLSGWEYLNVQAGLDFALGQALAIGPYLGFAGGNYTNIFASGAANTGVGNDYGGAIPTGARSFHAWIQLGVKGTAAF